MDISISICVRLMDKCISIMAIPLYVPDGVGPVTYDANNNNSTNNLQNRNNTRNENGSQIQYRVNAVSSSAPVQVHLDPTSQSHPVNISSFSHQLIAELYSFYQTHVLGVRANGNGSEVSPPAPAQRTMASLNSNQDNERGSTSSSGRRRNDRDAAEIAPSSPSYNYALPDIIQCHSGISLDVTFEASSVLRGGPPPVLANNNSTQTDLSALRRNPNRSNNNNDDMELLAREDWTLELKLLIGPWRQTGIELRAIADQFELENNRRRPLPARRTRSIKVRLLVNMALPAAALVGFGIAWLRRR